MAAENPWLPRRGVSANSALRLYCMPHAGGGTASYHAWSAALPDPVDVLPILLPGRERRISEPAQTDLRTTVVAIADALPPEDDLPYAVFGHSMGALLGFELCRELRRRQWSAPAALIVAAFRAPHLAPRSSPIHALSEPEFVTAIQDRFQGIPPEVVNNAELLSLFLPTLRADVQSIETYEYRDEPPLACPLMALGGVADAQVTPAELAAWREHTTGGFTQKMLPGGHFFVAERRSEVIRIVERQLTRPRP